MTFYLLPEKVIPKKKIMKNSTALRGIYFLITIVFTFLTSCSFPNKDEKPKEPQKLNIQFPNYQKLFSEGLSIEKIDALISTMIEKNESPSDTVESSELTNYQRWRSFWYGRQSKGMDQKFGPHEYLSALIDFSEHEVCKGTGDWNLIGPSRSPLYNGVDLHTMGAIFSLAADPNNLNIVYAGTGSGGLWKTTNALAPVPTWLNITDPLRLPSLGISDIVIDPSDNEIVYASTSSNPRHGYGLGVIKSMDGGTHWESTDLGLDPLNRGESQYHKLLIDPTNTNIVYALSDNDVFRTTDGGITWPAVASLTGLGEARNMEFNISDPRILYLSGGGIIKYNSEFDESQRLDLLSSFESPPVPSGYGAPIFEAKLSGVSDGCYALIEWSYPVLEGNGDPREIGEIKKYTESNDTWESINILSIYANILIVNQTNPDIIYLGHKKTLNRRATSSNCCTAMKSMDGGRTFRNITHYWPTSLYNGVSTHADIRAMKLLSSSNDGASDVLLVGSDGGLLLSQDITINGNVQMLNWHNLNGKGLEITEYYGVANNESNPYLIHGGTQDNGLISIDKPSWNVYTYGDGYDCIIDRENASLGFGQINYPKLCKTLNRGLTWSDFSPPSYCSPPCTTGFPKWWKVSKRPLVNDVNNTIYVGHYDIFKDSSGSWVPISAFSSLPTSTYVYVDPDDDEETIVTHAGTNLVTIEISKHNTDFIYAAFEGRTGGTYHPRKHRLFKTINGGENWIDITPPDARWFGITDVVSASNNPEKIWITYDRLPGTDDPRRVNYSPDGGQTWENWSVGLPPFPVNCIAYQEGSDDLLYVGTDVGIFYREGQESTTPWKCFNNNLPVALISDLELNYCTQKIRAATFGRGLWESPLFHTNSIPILDSDNDGVCDLGDQCPDIDDTLVGKSCDDGDLCTIEDVYDRSCNCVGTPNNNFDLVIRDNPVTDLGAEPNEGDIWSGNIWNCIDDPNCSSMENPEYKEAGINTLNVRIDNLGCISNSIGEARLHLYWTIGRAAELWPTHWFDLATEPTNYIDFENISAGGEITPSEGIPIPAISSGDFMVMTHQWTPPNPADFPSVSGDPMICFLARIESEQDPIIAEINGPIAGNVRNSNNIATINTTLIDIDPANRVFPAKVFYLNNPSKEAISYDILIEDIDGKQPSFFEQGTLEFNLRKVQVKNKDSLPVIVKITDPKRGDQLENIVVEPHEIIQVSIKILHSGKRINDGNKEDANFKLKIKNENNVLNSNQTEFLFDIKVMLDN